MGLAGGCELLGGNDFNSCCRATDGRQVMCCISWVIARAAADGCCRQTATAGLHGPGGHHGSCRGASNWMLICVGAGCCMASSTDHAHLSHEALCLIPSCKLCTLLSHEPESHTSVIAIEWHLHTHAVTQCELTAGPAPTPRCITLLLLTHQSAVMLPTRTQSYMYMP